jgi:hypothetical protein
MPRQRKHAGRIDDNYPLGFDLTTLPQYAPVSELPDAPVSELPDAPEFTDPAAQQRQRSPIRLRQRSLIRLRQRSASLAGYIRKRFGRRMFWGCVMERQRGNHYHIVYEDSDSEDMSSDEVDALLEVTSPPPDIMRRLEDLVAARVRRGG